MISALENPATDPTFLEFFGLTRPPFGRLSRSSENFHTEQYSTLTAHLASATKHPDCLVTISGVEGSGKTTLLNQYIASLGKDISFATFDETCNDEKKFYLAFLRQLGFSDISGKLRELRRITKEFLVHRGMAGDPVLIMVDNAQLMNPNVLEQLRWISATKVKDRRVVSVVLAGNSDLARIMDSPAMSQVAFRSQVNFNIRVYSADETSNYVGHRLKLAGGTAAVKFSDDAYPLIYRYTGGIPSLINMLCNAVLAEAYARKLPVISSDLVRSVADKRRLLPHVVPLKGKGRRAADPDYIQMQPDERTEAVEQSEEHIVVQPKSTRKRAENPAAKSAANLKSHGVNNEKLLEQISELSEQIGETKADKKRALQDIGTRDAEICEIRQKLDVQTAETEKLASSLAENADEIGRLNQALSDGKIALQKKEKASMKLAADLKLAEERVGEFDSLEETAATLSDEIEKTTGELLALQGELESRDEALADLEKLFQESQKDCALLRIRANELEELGRSESEKDSRIADLQAELATQRQEIMALDAKNEELESRYMNLAQAEGLSTLESELQDVSQRLKETQAQLSENQELTTQPATEAQGSPAPINQLPEYTPPSRRDEAGDQSPASMMTFEIIRNRKIERVVKVAEGQSSIMIGRNDDSELRLDSGFVSRHHALISSTEKGTFIEDLNSFNGTIINSKKISRCKLRPGDVIVVGDFLIRHRAPAEVTGKPVQDQDQDQDQDQAEFKVL